MDVNAITVYICLMKAKSKNTTRVYGFRFPIEPKSRFELFKEKMDAYAKKLKSELIKTK